MSNPAIIVDGLSKQYRIGLREKRHQTFREAIGDLISAPLRRFQKLREKTNGEDTIWALKDVSFEVQPGEVVGIIGRNGAGKTTLLKILSRITEPTEGTVRLRGQVASLLEVGTGFHPELTGRENIYLNGAILGMKKVEIDRKFDEIVAFAETEKFLDTPVKRYSSGMYVRLAFAVAAHLEPDILIVDEVLAVGDAEFQKRCLGKMKDVASGGRTVLFVSHNMLAVRNLCSRVIQLAHGGLVFSGDVQKGIEHYVAPRAGSVCCVWRRSSSPDSLHIARIELTLSGRQPDHRLRVDIDLECQTSHPPVFLAVDVFDTLGAWIMQAIPTVYPFIRCNSRQRHLAVEVSLPPLIPGRYLVGIWVGKSFSDTLDEVREAVAFEITESPTCGRNVPHQSARGYIVPVSTMIDNSAGHRSTKEVNPCSR